MLHDYPNRTRVLIVDNHPIVRCGLAAIIADQKEFELVGEASDGAEAFELFRRHRPDVTFMDLSLPDADGIDVISRMKEFESQSHYIVLTTRTGSDDINRALSAGAHAYLFKDSSCKDVLAALRTVAQGGRYLPPRVGRRADQLPRAMNFTARERQMLLGLARGLSNDALAQALGIGTETVKTHVKNILSKLNLKSRSEAVALCLQFGIIHSDDLQGGRF
jgi:DNA-binding NarL/FixJ family response regulator